MVKLFSPMWTEMKIISRLMGEPESDEEESTQDRTPKGKSGIYQYWPNFYHIFCNGLKAVQPSKVIKDLESSAEELSRESEGFKSPSRRTLGKYI